MKRKLFIISGPSGVGKTSISCGLTKVLGSLDQSISYTTRKPRSSEKDGKDYHFISYSQFTRLIKKGAFLEWASVLGHYYGTLAESINTILETGKDVLLCIDVQGAEQVKKKSPQAKSIFILPPDIAELKSRLEKRGENQSEIKKRLALAKKEIAMANEYDYIVENDILQKAVDLVKSIIIENRKKG